MYSSILPYTAAAGAALVVIVLAFFLPDREPERPLDLDPPDSSGRLPSDSARGEAAGSVGAIPMDFRAMRFKTARRYLWDRSIGKSHRTLFSVVPYHPLLAYVGTPDESVFWALACPSIDRHTLNRIAGLSGFREERDSSVPEASYVCALDERQRPTAIVAFRYAGTGDLDRALAEAIVASWTGEGGADAPEIRAELEASRASFAQLERQTADWMSNNRNRGSAMAYELFKTDRKIRGVLAGPNESVKDDRVLRDVGEDVRKKFQGREYRHVWSDMDEMLKSRDLATDKDMYVVCVAKLSDVADAVRTSAPFSPSAVDDEAKDHQCLPTMCTLAIEPEQFKLANSPDHCVCMVYVPAGTPVATCVRMDKTRRVQEVILKARRKLSPRVLAVQRVPGHDGVQRDETTPVVWCALA